MKFELYSTVHVCSSKACAFGTYKLSQGNEECQSCPDNSNTTDNGSIICPCDDGYYRADYEDATFPCTGNYMYMFINCMSLLL